MRKLVKTILSEAFFGRFSGTLKGKLKNDISAIGLFYIKGSFLIAIP